MNHKFLCLRLLLAAAVLATGTRALIAEEQNDALVEPQLIAILQTGAPAEKAMACKKLAIHGGKQAVPELAKLLADPQLASWARIALEAIPDASADAALRAASENLNGRLLVGVLNSIGVRRDAAATDLLTKRLGDADAEVASSAAVALGRIGNDQAVQALKAALGNAPAAVKAAVAEGCVLCAEKLLAAGNDAAATELYDAVRKADVPKPNKLQATRGAILARKADGIPLLMELLKSDDRGMVNIALTAARELPGQQVSQALATEFGNASPERAALLLYALSDRADAVATPAIAQAATTGAPQVRVAAIAVLGRSGNAASLAPLFEAAAAENVDVALAAKTALGEFKGEAVNQEILKGLAAAEGKRLSMLIALVGQRRIAATAPLVKALSHQDATVRQAALAALGETISPQELAILINATLTPKHADDGKTAARALKAACVRMPDRDACATELAAALAQANPETKLTLVDILGAVGGAKALATIASTIKSGDDTLQDAGSRLLGEWMTIDAAPVLLDLAKTASGDKYQVRAMRGYLRIARQFAMPVEQRAVMCRQALETARRAEEQQLALQILERYPHADTFKVAVFAASLPGLKDSAAATAAVVANKLTTSPDAADEMLKTAGLEAPSLTIIKAEYGSGRTQRDVSAKLRNYVRGSSKIVLPNGNYNLDLGGDPTPGFVKQLKVQYRLNGKAGEAVFNENAPIELPPVK